MHLIAAKQVAIQGKRPPCSVPVPSLGQLLLGKSGCACRSLAGTCLVGMASNTSAIHWSSDGMESVQLLRASGTHAVWSTRTEVKMW